MSSFPIFSLKCLHIFVAFFQRMCILNDFFIFLNLVLHPVVYYFCDFMIWNCQLSLPKFRYDSEIYKIIWMTELQKVLEHLIQTFYHSRVCFFPNILPRCRLFIVLVASMTFILLPMSLVFQMQVQFIHLFISFFEHLCTRVSFLLIYTLR